MHLEEISKNMDSIRVTASPLMPYQEPYVELPYYLLLISKMVESQINDPLVRKLEYDAEIKTEPTCQISKKRKWREF